MSQIEKNKAELFEMMEQISHEPLSMRNIGNLHELMGAYNAMCLVYEKEHTEDHAGHARTSQKAPQTV